MKRILFLLPKTQQGGAETQMLCLLKGIDKSQYQPYLGLLYKHPDLKNEFESIKGLEVIYFDKKGKLDISIFWHIVKFMKQKKIDIIHSFMGNYYSYIPALFTKNVIAIGGIRSVVENQYMTPLERFWEFKAQKQLINNNEFVLVSNSYKGKDLYVKKGFCEQKVKAIPNGINYKKFCSGNRKRIITEFHLKNNIVLGMVARLVSGKNHHDLIMAFQKLSENHKNIKLLIIGTGPLLQELEELSKNLSLQDRIIFTGNRKDIPDILSATDIFVFPSKFPEGWSNVIGEAMAAGVPVVSFDIGDAARIIKNGFDGFVVGQDMNKLIKVTEKLIENQSLRKRIGKKAAYKIKNKFSVEQMVKEYEHLYVHLTKNL